MGFEVMPVKPVKPEKQLSRKWQFSLREIVLVTAAIAAIIAITIQNRPRQTSQMARQLQPEIILAQIIKDKNLSGKAFKVAGNGSSSNRQVSHYSRIRLSGVSDSDVREEVMPELRKRIHDAIVDEGYKIVGRGLSGGRDEAKEWKSIAHFRFGYEGLKVKGQVRAITVFDKKGTPDLIIVLDEF